MDDSTKFEWVSFDDDLPPSNEYVLATFRDRPFFGLVKRNENRFYLSGHGIKKEKLGLWALIREPEEGKNIRPSNESKT